MRATKLILGKDELVNASVQELWTLVERIQISGAFFECDINRIQAFCLLNGGKLKVGSIIYRASQDGRLLMDIACN